MNAYNLPKRAVFTIISPSSGYSRVPPVGYTDKPGMASSTGGLWRDVCYAATLSGVAYRGH
jgi:hypothetical protein